MKPSSPGNKQLLRAINRSRIIKIIREQGPISRTEISKRSGLVLSTITKICSQLMDEAMIFEVGEGKSTGGRKPVNLLFNNSCGYVICVKIEIDRIITSVSTLKPNLVKSNEHNFALHSSFEEAAPVLLSSLQETVRECRDNGWKILGIGIAVSGIINRSSGEVLSSSLLGWKNVPLGRYIEERLHLEVHVDNDVNCFTLAQYAFGKQGKKSNILCVTIGEGIGAGVIINHRIFRGALGGAGEIGHSIVQIDGKPCYCGQRGCLEMYASDQAIVDFVHSKTGRTLSVEEIDREADKGNQACIDAFMQAGTYLGYGLLNGIMHYNPEVIVIGGKGTKEIRYILPHMEKVLENNWFHQAGICTTPLVFDALGNNAFLLGAALLVLNDLFGQYSELNYRKDPVTRS